MRPEGSCAVASSPSSPESSPSPSCWLCAAAAATARARGPVPPPPCTDAAAMRASSARISAAAAAASAPASSPVSPPGGKPWCLLCMPFPCALPSGAARPPSFAPTFLPLPWPAVALAPCCILGAGPPPSPPPFPPPPPLAPPGGVARPSRPATASAACDTAAASAASSSSLQGLHTSARDLPWERRSCARASSSCTQTMDVESITRPRSWLTSKGSSMQKRCRSALRPFRAAEVSELPQTFSSRGMRRASRTLTTCLSTSNSVA
mmetsp:Transcript_5342/g.15650  ORF Transcript_5342/g.15650 Transcript_5342/m.15650 type:complete len:265 (+) Transcript_5342:520-1314(+)